MHLNLHEPSMGRQRDPVIDPRRCHNCKDSFDRSCCETLSVHSDKSIKKEENE